MRTKLLFCFLLTACLASASTLFSFNCITNNTGNCSALQPQLSAAATDNGSTVTFDFMNLSGGLTSAITQIYFDDPSGFLSFGSISGGTQASVYVPGGSPSNLPGGNTVGFVTSFMVSPIPPPAPNGIAPGQDLKVTVDVAGGQTFSEVLGDGFNLGLHVQNYLGSSESLTDSVVATPEPASFVLLGGGLLLFGFIRKRHFAFVK